MTTTYFASLNEDEEQQVQQLLVDLAAQFAGMDFVEAHGYLCACVISSDQLEFNALLDTIIHSDNQVLDEPVRQMLLHFVEQATKDIGRTLYNDRLLELPCELSLGANPDQSSFRGWCLGFMDGIYEHEALWFDSGEGTSRLDFILPIALAAGESVDLPKDHPLSQTKTRHRAWQQIPADLGELYFNIREQSPVTVPTKPTKPRNKK